MSVLRINKTVLLQLVKCRTFATPAAIKNEDEYTASPQYPEIQDLSYEKKVDRRKAKGYEAIKSVKTVEEKQIKLNMPRYYGFKCYMIRENNIPYNNLSLIQHVTRTHLAEKKQLPDFYNKSTSEEPSVSSIKNDLEEAVLYELDSYKRLHDLRNDELKAAEREDILSKSMSKQVNRVILNNLSTQHPHLVDAQVDLDSRIESFWYAGGMVPPTRVRSYREHQFWQKDKVDEPSNRAMNYLGSANVALRSDKPLLPIIPHSEADNPDLRVPFFKFDPRTVGIATKYRHIANIPGFWPGDKNQFGLLSYHKRGHMLSRPFNDPQDAKEAVHRQAIAASFGWLSGQANFLGFNTFNDVTYPLVTQTIITNGKLWSFYVYQLNTLLMHSKHIDENPKRNVCWATPELKLYEDIKDGKIIGFNDEVAKILESFYRNVPEDRLGVNMTPYLSHDEKVSADYADEEQRDWIEREYKFLVANRPRLKLEYEIYAWEKIYKIDHKTMLMDARRRPFELFKNPWQRRLDDREAKYIPRALRPELPKHKGRRANEYFP